MPQLTVVVGDDHPVVREGVVRVLTASGEVQVVGEAADGVELLTVLRARLPQVALVDFRMPGLDGAQIADAVRREALPTRVLVLSAYTEPAMVFRAMESGAAGYLSKEAGRAEILQAIAEAAAGRDVLPPRLAQGLLGEIRARRDDGSAPLSSREREVLAGLAAGKSVPTMATELFLAPSTVKTHVQRLYVKLGVTDRGAAVAEAMRRRLLS